MTEERIQHGGTHYLDLKIHPYQFAMANRWDVCAFSTLKYLSRYRGKGKPIEDLKKALQFVEFRAEYGQSKKEPLNVISMVDYVEQNEIDPRDREALYCLQELVFFPVHDSQMALTRAINRLLEDAIERQRRANEMKLNGCLRV